MLKRKNGLLKTISMATAVSVGAYLIPVATQSFSLISKTTRKWISFIYDGKSVRQSFEMAQVENGNEKN